MFVRRGFLPSLFKAFSSAPFYEPYEDMLTRLGGDSVERVPTLVFPRKGLKQGLAMHGPGLERFPYRGVSLVHVPKGTADETPVTIYVRPFSCLLEAVYRKGHGWKPDS